MVSGWRNPLRAAVSTGMTQPLEPSKEDCCNSGCNPCIFEVYEKQLKQYQKNTEIGTSSTEPTPENGISQLEYTSFVLLQIVEMCDTYILLKFLKLHQDHRTVHWKPGDHFLLKFISEDISCTRAYTPLQHRNTEEKYDFSIIIKIWPNGLVSNYLNGLKPGDHTLWRGPYGSYELTSNKYVRIIMIAQGTGIVTLIEIIEKILCNEDDITQLILYYCCQSIDKILFREELYSFKLYWNFSYKIFLSNTKENAKCKYQEPIAYQKLNVENIRSLQPFTMENNFLICGSLAFMESYEILLNTEGVLLKNIIKF